MPHAAAPGWQVERSVLAYCASVLCPSWRCSPRPSCVWATRLRLPSPILRLVPQALLRPPNRPDFPLVVRGGIEHLVAEGRRRLQAPLHDLGHIPMREPQGTRQGRARRVIRGENPADPEVQGRHLMVVPVITAQRLPKGLGRAVVAIWPDGTGL